MSFPAYPAYKDSGVEWLGVVPDHWVVALLKRGYEVALGKMLQPEARRDDDEFLPYLRAANIQSSGVDNVDVKYMWFSAEEKKLLLLRRGDLLVSEGGDVGRSAIWDFENEECYFQNSINRIRSVDGNETRFLYFWMTAIKKNGYIDMLCNKSTIAHFTAEKVAAVPMPLPTKFEQVQIARFLDHKTAHIDALIEDQQRLIELLKEKRQAVIFRVVTKGLNPTVPMKDSGVDWLGQVPQHWQVGALGYFAGIDTGATPDRGNPKYWGGDIPWIKTGEVNYDNISQAEECITREGVRNSAVKVAPKGTLLMAMYGQGVTRGRVAILDIEAAYNQACAGIFVDGRIRVEYLRLFLIAAYPYVRDGGNEASQMNLSSGHVAKIKIAVPPIIEQVSSERFLDEEMARFDSLINQAGLLASNLQELRSALISAAVTGKIDVRAWQSPARLPAPELVQEVV
ncbi:TPA: restriction endonuclease subunit S [Stenotrophomonas maltophilia]|nr:restriction endonuclease subunit S [Stenotrophomonas maltophilia]HEL3779722.1 restriction endonuclease subunit S [Stenotrophomonas maltophilia]HEL5006431.1 restriction endonuclease subunit S [Stenotrophomonas maltophilia]